MDKIKNLINACEAKANSHATQVIREISFVEQNDKFYTCDRAIIIEKIPFIKNKSRKFHEELIQKCLKEYMYFVEEFLENTHIKALELVPNARILARSKDKVVTQVRNEIEKSFKQSFLDLINSVSTHKNDVLRFKILIGKMKVGGPFIYYQANITRVLDKDKLLNSIKES